MTYASHTLNILSLMASIVFTTFATKIYLLVITSHISYLWLSCIFVYELCIYYFLTWCDMFCISFHFHLRLVTFFISFARVCFFRILSALQGSDCLEQDNISQNWHAYFCTIILLVRLASTRYNIIYIITSQHSNIENII